MPLVRYEVRCEHSLANPELYRSAARNDPEGLLEGVAMAGLVGIVRQLGDLAEFAAEIFRDLHDELMALGGRGHDLTVRVQQLEAELPAVEKALLSEPNQLRFAYTNGADWHASIRSDQNHCTSGDLPRFVRNFYEECRGPPRLFLLDKFDVAGAGACLKRYTDPSFFKLEWASSELMKAQRAQRDKKARKEKKKGRRRKTGQPIAAIHQIPARVRYGSASLEELDGLPQLLASTLKAEVPSLAPLGVSHEAPMQTRKGSALGPKGMSAEESSLSALKPIRVSPLSNEESVFQASQPLKISAKDIESANFTGKFYRPSEPEGVAGSMAGRISKIIEMEDHAAAPPATGLSPKAADNKGFKVANGSKAPAPVHSVGMSRAEMARAETKATKRVSREDLEAAAMARTGRISRGTSRGNSSMGVRGPATQLANGTVAQGTVPDVTEPALLQAKPPTVNVMDVNDPARLSEKFAWRNSLDSNQASSIGGRLSRQISMARAASDGDDFVDAALAMMESTGDFDFKAQVGLVGDGYKATDMEGNAKLNHTDSDEHMENQENHIPPGVDLMEQPYSLPTSGTLASASQLATEGADEAITEDAISETPPLELPSPISAILNEGPPSPSALSRKSDTPTAGGHIPVQQSERQGVEKRGDSAEAFEVSQGAAESERYIQPVPVVEIPEHGEESHMLSLMATSPTASSLGSSATSPAKPTPGREIRQPSISMLSRRSYSSELISVSSDSEPTSPISMKSPAFDTLYLPPGSPSRTTIDMVHSPSGTYMGAHAPSAPHSHHSSRSPSESPVLSLPPTSPTTSSSSGPLADWGNQAGPSGPAPVRPPPVVLPRNSEPVSLPSQAIPQHYPLPSPPISPQPDSSTDPISEDLNPSSPGVSNPQATAHTESPLQSPGDVEQSPTSRLDAEAPADFAPTSYTEPVRPLVEYSEEHFPSSPPRSTTPTPAFTQLMRSSLILPPRPADSPGSSAPTSPVGSSKRAFQRIFLSSSSVQATPSPLGNAVEDAPPSPSGRDEESAPSSPSGSVIIKDTPSPPASPASSCSEGEFEDLDFDAPPGRSRSLVSPESIRHALEDEIINRQQYCGEITVPESPRSESKHSAPASPVDIQRSPLMSPTSHAASEIVVEISPEISLESPLSNVSTDHQITQETSPLPCPPTSLQSNPHPASPPQITECTTLRPILTTRANSRSQNSLASNSPPDSPPREEELPREDGPSSLQWRGRSKPSSSPTPEFRLPPASPARSPSNSPPNSPPKSLWSEASSFKWRGRVDPEASPPQPDFSLPPNLVCGSDLSSPPCSPPPHSDSESPAQWVARLVRSDDSDSSASPLESPRKGMENVGVYHLPDSPLPPDSPTMSEEGDHLPGPSSTRHDFDDDCGYGAEHRGREMGRPSGPRLPSSSSNESLFHVASDIPAESYVHSVAATKLKMSPPPLIEGSVTEVLPRTASGATTNSLPEAEGSERYGSPAAQANEPPPPPPMSGFELRKTLNTKDALAAAIAQHDRNMFKVLTFQEPVQRPPPPPDKRSILLEEIRTKSFNLRRTDSIEKKEPAPRPVANISVAAILEKASAIRQAFVGSDEEDNGEDDWSDS